jgi:hypothetical protein
MNIVRKDATITNTDDAFPGSFDVILSAPTEDRDGETLLPGEWKTPLPDRITFDADHGMSVASTVGSGVPSLNDAGELVVSGTYSSLPRAQEVRTLVNEGHINTTSVAFMSEKSTAKGGKQTVTRELLNGAFVSVPSNREALVLSSKSGARNSKTDAGHIQTAHDSLVAAGAACPAPMKSFGRKDADTEDQSDPAALIAGVDATIDEAIDLFAAVDVTTLPAEVQQAIALIQAADATVDELLDALGIPDPDEAAEPPAAADQAAADVAAAKSAAADEHDALDVQNRSLQAQVNAFTTE